MRKDFSFLIWVLVVVQWKRTAGKCRSGWNETVVLQPASRPGYVAAGTAVTDERDERMDGMDVKESHSPLSVGPAVEAPSVEPAAYAGTTLLLFENVVEHQRNAFHVTWSPNLAERRTCSFDACVNMNRLQTGS